MELTKSRSQSGLPPPGCTPRQTDTQPVDTMPLACDMMRDAILTCARKLSQLNLLHGNNRKNNKWIYGYGIGKQSRESMGAVLKKKRKAMEGKESVASAICSTGGLGTETSV